MADIVANSLRIIEYSERDARDWDEFLAKAPMATFLHMRRFLSYHGALFRDASLIFRNQKGQVVGVLPAAIDPQNDRRIISHPGITYGGLLHQGHLYGEKMIEALDALRGFYAARGFESICYKAVPKIYHQTPSEDDLYALFRVGARRIRCDLSCAIDLSNRREPSSRRKRSLKKALEAGVTIAEGPEFIERLWKVIEENLQRKLGQRPVHTAEEISHLHSLFPNNIRFVVALLKGEIVAGVALFSSSSVTRAQYIASNEVGYAVSALDAVFDYAINQARVREHRFFDFGTSNKDEGRQLSADVYNFKIEFGAGGVAQEFYEMDLGV